MIKDIVIVNGVATCLRCHTTLGEFEGYGPLVAALKRHQKECPGWTKEYNNAEKASTEA